LPSLATTLAVRSAVEAASVTSPIHRAFGFCGPHAAPAALCSSTVDLARPAGVAGRDNRLSAQMGESARSGQGCRAERGSVGTMAASYRS
jgi:hypothetical protein